jgi:hypothetical protein
LQTENPASVLVCVTDQPSCRRLILAGNAIAQEYGLPVKVVTVLKPGLVSAKTADVLQTLYNIAGHLGAEMTVYFNDSPALTVAVHARQTNAVHLVSGYPGADSNRFIETIKGLLPEVPVSMVDDNQQIFTFPSFPTGVAAHDEQQRA